MSYNDQQQNTCRQSPPRIPPPPSPPPPPQQLSPFGNRQQQGFGNLYLDHLSAASNLTRLLEFYRASAPICIGGPSSTNLKLTKFMHGDPNTPSMGGSSITKHRQQDLQSSAAAAVPTVPASEPPLELGFYNELSPAICKQLPSPAVTLPTAAVAATAILHGGSTSMRTRHSTFPTVSRSFANLSRGGSHDVFYERVKAMRNMAMAVNGMPPSFTLFRSGMEHLQPQGSGKFVDRQGTRNRPHKRRRTTYNHLSGDMIRRLREKYKKQGLKAREMTGSILENQAHEVVAADRFLVPMNVAHAGPNCPILSKRDSSSSELVHTTVNGDVIAAFDIGGEHRLCLPHFLKQNLADFPMEEIRRTCAELQIHWASCTSDQLTAMKASGVLPLGFHQCFLITKTDAERLTSYLKAFSSHSRIEDETDASNSSHGGKDVINGGDESVSDRFIVDVQHKCFGKVRGKMFSWLYTTSSSKCIKCNECHVFLTPPDFVRHLHSCRENRTCHWGFNIDHWRSYLRASSSYLNDDYSNYREAEKMLDTMKGKFAPSSQQPKRILDEGSDDDEEGRKRPPCAPPSRRCSLSEEALLGHGNNNNNDFDENDMAKFRPWSSNRPPLVIVSSQDVTLADVKDNNNLKIRSEDSLLNPHRRDKLQIEMVKDALNQAAMEPDKRDFVLGVIQKLTDRVISAENSENRANDKLLTLKRRIQLLEKELSNKCEELRRWSQMRRGVSAFAISNAATVATLPPRHLAENNLRAFRRRKQAVLAGENQQPLFERDRFRLVEVGGGHDDDDGADRDSNLKLASSSPVPLRPAPLAESSEDHEVKHVNDGESNASPISVYSNTSKTSEDLREWMLTMESEVRSLKSRLSGRNNAESKPTTGDDQKPNEPPVLPPRRREMDNRDGQCENKHADNCKRAKVYDASEVSPDEGGNVDCRSSSTDGSSNVERFKNETVEVREAETSSSTSLLNQNN